MSVQEKSAEAYWKSGGQTVGPYVYFKQEILNKLFESKKTVLDVGCGDGLTTSVIAKDNLVYGVELSDTALIAAKAKNLKSIKHNLDEGLPPIEKKFDAILLLDILEHLQDPNQLLNASINLMNEQTLLVVSVPNTMNLLTRLFFLFGRYVDVMDKSHKEGEFFSEHLHVFSKKKLEDLLKSKGLKIKSRHYYFPTKFNEEAYKKYQFLGDIINLLRFHEITPSLFALGFLYECELK